MKRSPLLALCAVAALSLPAMLAQSPKNGSAKVLASGAKTAPTPRKQVIRPVIPTADRHQPDKVFIEYAERLDKLSGSETQILVGNVQFRKGDMFMYCDSARFNESTSSLDAFRNVRMEQGDTLFVYGDELYYNGETELAELRAYPGGNVRLINRDVSLTTPVFFYDIAQDVGYYMTGGTLHDKQNTLKSLQGYYYPSTKDAFFYLNVDLTGPRPNDTLRMYTDSLTYNTATNIAQLMCRTLIVSKDGEITSTSGFYDTRTGVADLYERSTVHTRRGNTLTGDTLFYDRDSGFGEAFGNMILTDSANHSSIIGDYGFYDDIRDSAFVTGNALALEYSRPDTLYLHGDTITAKMYSDSTRVTDVFHRVRFFRNDVQGLCDSLSLVERDSILYMYYNPIVWNGDKQIAGNVIYLHFNDSTTDWARLPEAGLMSQHIAEDCYNQLSGTDMTAWFADTTLRRLYVEGNVQVIMFPMENDSTYNKFNFSESSYLDAYFLDGDIERIRMWPQTTGKMTPLYLAKRASYFLPKFRWYGPLRPMSPDEVFDYPSEMADLMSQNILGKMSSQALTVRGQATGRPKPPAPAVPPVIPADTTAMTDSLMMLSDSISLHPDSLILTHDSISVPASLTGGLDMTVPEEKGETEDDGEAPQESPLPSSPATKPEDSSSTPADGEEADPQ